MFAYMSMSVEPFSLDDGQIEQAAPRVRALTLRRLEAIWDQVEKHLDPDVGADPRWAEIGLRVLDREARLYRLDRGKAPDPDEGEEWVGVDRGALLLKQLEQVSERLRQDSGQTGT